MAACFASLKTHANSQATGGKGDGLNGRVDGIERAQEIHLVGVHGRGVTNSKYLYVH